MRRSWLSTLAVVGAWTFVSGCACDGGIIGPPGDPPVVTVTIPDANVVGPAFRVSISISGCEARTVELYDRDQFVQTIGFGGNPTVIALTPQQLRFQRFAGTVVLTAKVICQDGRTNTSLAAAGKFWPAIEVIDAPLLPETFVAEGSGNGVTFIGCAADGSLIKVAKAGNEIARNNAIPACNASAFISDRHPATGKRWLFQAPNPADTTAWAGAMAFRTGDLAATAIFNGAQTAVAAVRALAVGPDGDAVVWDAAYALSALRRIAHGGGAGVQPRWTADLTGIALTGFPVVDASQSVVAPTWVEGAGTGTVGIDRFSYSTGIRSAHRDLRVLGAGTAGILPPSWLNASGSILYFSTVMGGGASSQLFACGTTTDGCLQPGVDQKWISPALPGIVAAVIPFAKFSRLAAIAPNVTFFLSADTGMPVASPTNGVLNPGGQLVSLQAQWGSGRDFYLLNGPDAFGAAPMEIIAVDSPEQGEVYRYQILSGSVSVAVDDAGEVWFRVGQKLARPYPLQEYRIALQ